MLTHWHPQKWLKYKVCITYVSTHLHVYTCHTVDGWNPAPPAMSCMMACSMFPPANPLISKVGLTSSRISAIHNCFLFLDLNNSNDKGNPLWSKVVKDFVHRPYEHAKMWYVPAWFPVLLKDPLGVAPFILTWYMSPTWFQGLLTQSHKDLFQGGYRNTWAYHLFKVHWIHIQSQETSAIIIRYNHTVDGSEIPNNHLECTKSCK